MTKVMLTCGDYQFFARLEEEKAPRTCAIFKKMLPIEDRLIHVRWSGEGMWIPMGDTRWEGLDFENHTKMCIRDSLGADLPGAGAVWRI